MKKIIFSKKVCTVGCSIEKEIELNHLPQKDDVIIVPTKWLSKYPDNYCDFDTIPLFVVKKSFNLIDEIIYIHVQTESEKVRKEIGNL